MSKAEALPVNILVVVAVAIVATLGLMGVYGVGYNPFSSALGLESVKNAGCRQLVMGGCKANTSAIQVKYDANKDGNTDSSDNLLILCKNFLEEMMTKLVGKCAGALVLLVAVQQEAAV
jgi:hypothetical protein